jgi:hypothetical protein
MISILADVLTADMGLIPGLAFAGPAMGLPLSVLAAFVERPFYTLAGIEHKTIWYSLQANFLSLVIGIVILLVVGPILIFTPLGMILDPPSIDWELFGVSLDPLGLGWALFAIAASTFIEGRFLSRRHPHAKGFWLWTAIGNVTSAAGCIALLVLILGLRKHFPDWGEAVKPYELTLNLTALGGSGALFLLAFRRTRGDASDALTRSPSPPISEN